MSDARPTLDAARDVLRARFGFPDFRPGQERAVTAVLAGELEGGWTIRWRMKVFFWIVKLQARWALVPRLSFREEPSGELQRKTEELVFRD